MSSMLRRSLIVAIVALSVPEVSCSAATQSPQPLVDALLGKDQEALDELVRAFLEGEVQITPDCLQDERKVSSSLILKVVTVSQTLQLGPERVDDALMCLLEIREPVELSRIPATEDCSQRYECDVCNSATYPISDELRAEFREHWSQVLGLRVKNLPK